ncbi:hypothetical protein Acr_00g0082330 [Actinidia rufa]|uniref:RNase H type-1 domain-containing protein n=1 Tax=Actinidia rufa TaxID=165716 RepID=A0A7J0DUW6_9ERIC|nr:hypothetical protein Acr_00g0082330 [Actinidia rufa]
MIVIVAPKKLKIIIVGKIEFTAYSLCKSHQKIQEHTTELPVEEAIPMNFHWWRKSWSRLAVDKNHCKLNTDGALKGNLGQATAGGLIRNSNGEWIAGFHRDISKASSLEAEIWAIRDHLQLAANINLPLLHVEMDCTTAIQLLMGNKEKRHQLIAFIHDCGCLVRRLALL